MGRGVENESEGWRIRARGGEWRMRARDESEEWGWSGD